MKDIQEFGLPCEIEATANLEAHGWTVNNQSAFVDEDTQKLRHVDIVSDKYAKKAKLLVYLILECSKSAKPWLSLELKLTESPNPAVVPSHFPYQNNSEWTLQFKLHQANKKFFEGHIPYEPFTGGKCTNIFDASMKVVKALEYQVLKRKEWEEDKLKRNLPHIFYPIVVLDGTLYAISIAEGKILASKKSYITYLFQNRERYHLIDVVTKQGLNELIGNIDIEILAIDERIQK